MPVREPIVAGQFYPRTPEQCRAEVESCLAAGRAIIEPGLRPVAGIAPHAGWVCSGVVAAEVIKVLACDPAIETFVVFGAAHRVPMCTAAVFASGVWHTPLGDVEIDEPLARAVVAASPAIADDPDAHDGEHSIEVEVPFIRHLAPSARLLPILVPPLIGAEQIGRLVAEQAQALDRRIAVLASTDLTHYGPRYHFTPQGSGSAGISWAKEVNDRRLLELVLGFQADKVVPEAAAQRSACGPGAVAATIAAAVQLGATHAQLLRHTSSYEVLRDRVGEMQDSVGYAGIVFLSTAELAPR